MTPKYSSSGTLIALTIGVCGLFCVSALFVVASLCRDLNILYEEITADLGEFKGIADDAWKKMMEDEVAGEVTRIRRQNSGYGPASTPAGNAGGQYEASSVSALPKSAQSSKCNCGRQPNNCAAGPPGPKGQAGIPGEEGTPGQPGLAGQSALGVAREGAHPSNCDHPVRQGKLEWPACLEEWGRMEALDHQEPLEIKDHSGIPENKELQANPVLLDNPVNPQLFRHLVRLVLLAPKALRVNPVSQVLLVSLDTMAFVENPDLTVRL
uniref:Col_cuticle_N domain-containing protein n=1 Tax=Globodera pallida TaxID=36090 RepID=A0A183CLY3_GLOPA